MTYQDAKYAQQTSPQSTTLARHGDRYGLRSDTLNAQGIHEKHRPDTPLLLGQSKMIYAVGPLPFSTTKAALNKLLKAWNWDERPLQPKERAQDDSGITWHIQAIEDPDHWVHSLQHGDVLVTKLQDTKPVAHVKPFSIVASKKTMEHLQGTDPWLQSDPWSREGQASSSTMSAKAQPVKPSGQPVTHAQLAAMEASLDKKIQMATKPTDNDVPMETAHMESRIALLEQQFQQAQVLQQGTDAKVSQLQQQMDQQSKLLGDRMDEKLNTQMERIEMLLCKRSRHEWLGSDDNYDLTTKYSQRILPSMFRSSASIRPRAIFANKFRALCMLFVVFSQTFRLGEATTPGPVLGNMNPTGLMGKASEIASLPAGVYMPSRNLI